jgi:Glutamate racemase
MEKRPIGFFDSGVGGLSVLKEAKKLMPNEDFIYFWRFKRMPLMV